MRECSKHACCSSKSISISQLKKTTGALRTSGRSSPVDSSEIKPTETSDVTTSDDSVTEIGSTKARSSPTKDLAITICLTIAIAVPIAIVVYRIFTTYLNQPMQQQAGVTDSSAPEENQKIKIFSSTSSWHPQGNNVKQPLPGDTTPSWWDSNGFNLVLAAAVILSGAAGIYYVYRRS